MGSKLELELNFSIIPEWVIDSGVSDKAIRLYAVLARYADNRTGEAFPSRDTLAARMSCSAKSVDRAAQELLNCGAVTKRQRHNSSLVYTVKMSRGVDVDVQGGSSPVSRGVDTSVHLTRTTELEPENVEPLKGKPARKSRLPEDWYPSDRLLMMFDSKWPTLDRDFEIEQFTMYWHSAGGVKLDWDLTFQGWMNRNEKQARERSAWRDEKSKTNSERNVEKLRASMAMLDKRKEVEDGQA